MEHLLCELSGDVLIPVYDKMFCHTLHSQRVSLQYEYKYATVNHVFMENLHHTPPMRKACRLCEVPCDI